METTNPPPPSAVSQKSKPVKKPKKTTKLKKPKTLQSSQQGQLSPLSKTDKTDDPKRKLYDLYENFHISDTKNTDAEIKIAEQNRIELLRDMLVKTFGSKNLNPLNKIESHPQNKQKIETAKINEKGDTMKSTSDNTNASKPKAKQVSKKGTKATKKSKPAKKVNLKNIE